jgi:transcriptional regulator with XRE-family HTH domain
LSTESRNRRSLQKKLPKDRTTAKTTGESDAAQAFGDRLREARLNQGLTLKQVSEISGISIAYLSDLERGVLTNPTLDTLRRLASALRLSLNDLLGIEEQQKEARYPEALEHFRVSPGFLAAVADEATRHKRPQQDVERDWLRALAGLRVGRRAPRDPTDYQFLFETLRRTPERR